MPRTTVTRSVDAPAACDPRGWRLTGGGIATGAVLLLLGMFGVLAGAEFPAGKRGGEISGSLALAAPVVLIVTAVLHLCLRRVRSRTVYIAGVGVRSRLGDRGRRRHHAGAPARRRLGRHHDALTSTPVRRAASPEVIRHRTGSGHGARVPA